MMKKQYLKKKRIKGLVDFKTYYKFQLLRKYSIVTEMDK